MFSLKTPLSDPARYQRLVRQYPTVVGRLLSVLHDIRKRRQNGGPPCDRCFGPAAECICERLERCGWCAGPGIQCVCVNRGECASCFKTVGYDCACSLPLKKCACDACVDCETRASSNRRDLKNFIDSVLVTVPDAVSPPARPAMIDVIDSLLQAIDGNRALRLKHVRASIARKMFGRTILPQVCALLEQIHGLSCEDDGEWGRIFVLMQDLRDVFVHARVPAMVIHREFGRMCAVVCDAMAIIQEGERWLNLPPCQRQQAMGALMASVGRSLAGVDLSFLGEWGQQRVMDVCSAVSN